MMSPKDIINAFLSLAQGKGTPSTGQDPQYTLDGLNISTNDQNPKNTNFSDIFNRILGGSTTNDDILQLLYTLSINQNGKLSGDQRDDWNKQLLDSLLNYSLTQENRLYNEGIRDEQRLYDSPLNQLLRLTGAGISRDAAIAMLSGSGSGVGSAIASQPAVAAPGIAPSQSKLNGIQGQTAIANTVLNGINTIAGLVGVGMSIPQALGHVKSLGIQNEMSQKALIGLQASDSVLGSLENAVSTGVLSTVDIDGFSSATDALNYIYDHRDTDAFKPVFDNGSFQQVYGTKLGREMFSNSWNNVRQSKDAGKMLDQFIKHSDLQNELLSIQGKAAQRDYFFGFQSAINQLLKDDAQIQSLWNDVLSGNIKILIDGEVYEQQKVATAVSHLSQTSAERASYREGVEFDAFKSFVENGEPEEPLDNSNGQSIINYLTFGDWYNKLQHMLVTTSSSEHVKDSQGYSKYDYQKNRYITPRDEYKEFLRTHQDLLYTGVAIQQIIQEGRLNSWNGNAQPIWQFFDMWRSSGASDFVKSATNAAGDAGAAVLPLVLP